MPIIDDAHEIVSKELTSWKQNTNQLNINRDADEFLKSSVQSLNALSDSRIAAFIYNYEKGNYTYFNDFFAQLMQSNRDYIDEKGILIMQERVHPEDFLKCLELTQKTLAEYGKMKDIEKENTQLRLFFRILKETGEYSWVMQCNYQVKWKEELPPISLAYITELFNEHHPMRVLAVLQTNSRLIEILPSSDNELPNKLSNREMEVLQLVKIGLSSLKISEKLNLSANTIKTHRKNILRKLKVKNMAQALRQMEARME